MGANDDTDANLHPLTDEERAAGWTDRGGLRIPPQSVVDVSVKTIKPGGGGLASGVPWWVWGVLLYMVWKKR